MSPSSVLATVCTSAPSKFISTPSPFINAACCSEAVRISGSRSRGRSGCHVRAGKQERLSRFARSRALAGFPEFPSFAAGKRGLKSALRTESSPSVGCAPAIEAIFDAPQPPSAKQLETARQARVQPNQPPPMRFIHNYLPAVAPHGHIYGERPLPLSRESRNASSAGEPLVLSFTTVGILRTLCGQDRDLCGKPTTILRHDHNF